MVVTAFYMRCLIGSISLHSTIMLDVRVRVRARARARTSRDSY